MKRLAWFVLPVFLVACSPAAKGASGPPRSATTSTTAARAPVAPCATPVHAVAVTMVPHDVEAWAHGATVVGSGALWTIRSAFGVPGTVYQHGWLVKFPWLTRPFGLPRIDARRVDGPGTFRADVNRAVGPTGVFVTSSLMFSNSGCWEITTRYDGSVLQFRLEVGHAP